MTRNEPITLRRDCEAIEIPIGNKVILHAGSQVVVTQALGGTYTVMTDRGHLVRIEGKDADAIGLETAAAEPVGLPAAAEGTADVEKLVWNQLRTCYDPEIPVNIAELGLVYACVITSLPDGGNTVEIQMTLTAPGCGMGATLKAEVERRVLTVPDVKGVNVELVWDPIWDPSMMSEAARLQLGLM